jgi:hypothetical protein
MKKVDAAEVALLGQLFGFAEATMEKAFKVSMSPEECRAFHDLAIGIARVLEVRSNLQDQWEARNGIRSGESK